MIFGKGERRRTICTSSENLTKSTEIAAFWQGSYYSRLACLPQSLLPIFASFSITIERVCRLSTRVAAHRFIASIPYVVATYDSGTSTVLLPSATKSVSCPVCESALTVMLYVPFGTVTVTVPEDTVTTEGTVIT